MTVPGPCTRECQHRFFLRSGFLTEGFAVVYVSDKRC